MWGTYLLTRWYHLFSATGFWSAIWRIIVLSAKLDMASFIREAEIATKLGSVHPEAKAESLVGVYYIFLGFVLQLGGARFWGADALWSVFWGPPT